MATTYLRIDSPAGPLLLDDDDGRWRSLLTDRVFGGPDPLAACERLYRQAIERGNAHLAEFVAFYLCELLARAHQTPLRDHPNWSPWHIQHPHLRKIGRGTLLAICRQETGGGVHPDAAAVYLGITGRHVRRQLCQ